MERKLDIHLQFELPDNYDIDIITDELDDKKMSPLILSLIAANKEEIIDTCKNASAQIN